MNSNKFLWVLWIETHQTSFTHQLVPFLLLEKDNRGHFGELSVTSNCQLGCFAGSFTPFRLQEDSGFGVEGLRVNSGIVKLMDIFDDNCGGYNYHTFPIISKGLGHPAVMFLFLLFTPESIPLQMLLFENLLHRFRRRSPALFHSGCLHRVHCFQKPLDFFWSFSCVFAF